jgi:hypothetical protein
MIEDKVGGAVIYILETICRLVFDEPYKTQLKLTFAQPQFLAHLQKVP